MHDQLGIAMASSISLQRIVDLRVPIAWQEAVAVAEAVKAEVYENNELIGLETCYISDDGSLEIIGIPVKPFTGNPGLAILRALVDQKNAPTALIALAKEPVTAEGVDEKLHFFARPDPVAEIKALAVRAIAVDLDAAAKRAIEEIRSEVGTAPDKPSSPRRVSRRTMIAAAVVVFAVAIAIGAWTRPSASADAADVPAPPAADLPSNPQPSKEATPFASLLNSAMAVLRGDGGSATDAPKKDIVLAPPRAPRKPQPAPSPAPPAVEAAAPVLREERAPLAPVVVIEEPIVVDPNTYDNEHATVEAPVLLRPQLPRMIPLPPGAGNGPHLALLINREGTVDTVRLVGNHNLHNRMLLSAAKAWIFQPASKDGVPVRYWLRVPLPQ